MSVVVPIGPNRAQSASYAAQSGRLWPTPAVGHAFRIIDYLAGAREAGVTEIARELGLNKSTCFSILATLQALSVVTKSKRNAVYRLGPKLVDLGTATRRNFSARDTILGVLQGLVDREQVTAFVAQVLVCNSGLVVIDRIHPRKEHVFQVPIGHFIPPGRPAMARLLLSYEDELDALRLAADLGLVNTKDNEHHFLAELARARELGYVPSLGDYAPDANAVVAGVTNAEAEVDTVLGLADYASDLPAERIPDLGTKLAEVAHISKAARESAHD
jgi:DNA-binding IclR family transcriptional regulator